jgi:hypothetical protein
MNTFLGKGPVISNVVVNCTPNASGTFTASGTNLGAGMTQGILLTSGSAGNAVGPNIVKDNGSNNGRPGDPDIDAIAGEATRDACILEFDFIPNANTISFEYMMRLLL